MKLLPGGRIIMGVIAWVALALGACLLLAWRTAIEPIVRPAVSEFDPAVVHRGAQLAALGNCASCHTAPGGEPLTGGRALSTPFGTLYSTNITPDPKTGIGHWSRAAFRRAMREGVDREGRQLYPAFPYDHFTLVNDTDDDALYAYLMTRRSVPALPRENQLRFPMNVRWLLGTWKLLFFREGQFQADAAHDAQWNRGAYLVNGLGHCGACHTPRNRFGAEIPAQRLAGSDAQGWYAYAINSASQARVPWDAAALSDYFRTGWQSDHGVAHGPMAEVTNALAEIADSDRSAMSTYVGWMMSQEHRAHGATKLNGPADRDGALVYAGACARCHDGTRALPFGGIRLQFSTAVSAAN